MPDAAFIDVIFLHAISLLRRFSLMDADAITPSLLISSL